MKLKQILPVSATTLALAGIISLQGYWIYEAYLANESANRWIPVLSVIFMVMAIWGYIAVLQILLRQNRLSDIKNDFINNMTHEFKTPLATIQVAGEMLINPNVHEYPYKVIKYAQVILDENNRVRSNVEQILQLSVMDIHIKQLPVNLHPVLETLARHFSVDIQERHGVIRLELNAKEDLVSGDTVHLTNVFSNLIDNAVKYSSNAPDIIIRTENKNGMIDVSIKDHGAGIRKSEQKNIFKNLYRIPTGNVHDVKGFGIGLYYVKMMINAHQGSIGLHSELNHGSTFTVKLPLKKNEDHG